MMNALPNPPISVPVGFALLWSVGNVGYGCAAVCNDAAGLQKGAKL